MTTIIVHNPTAAVTVINPHTIIDGQLIIAVTGHHQIAERLAQLWDRYGATDVPDTVEGVGE